MPTFAIYYADGSVVRGSEKRDWMRAPDSGVQYVVLEEPPPEPFPIPERFVSGIVGCNRLYPTITVFTGVDSYDPAGMGKAKDGTLTDEATYDAIWQQLLADYGFAAF